jgi:ribosomal protein S18 acetylase RimI-like enzyme
MTILTHTDIEVFFQPATVADLNALARLIRRYFAFDHIPFDAAAIRSGLKAMFNDKSVGQAFLIATESKPIGYTILANSFDLEFGGPVAVMTDLYLEPEYRRLGIGKKTIRFLEQLSRKEGKCALEFLVERDNTGALSFYKRQGFVTYNRIPMSKRLRAR